MDKPKNLSQLKKYIQIGTKFKLQRGQDKKLINREVVEVQSNGIWCKGDKIGENGLSWLEYPKAKNIDFTDDYFYINKFLKYYYN